MKKLNFLKITQVYNMFKSYNSLKQKEKNLNRIEEGRSMVEILGVLAIIGVLSIGGIMGYRFAMDKYRANDIVNEVNLRNRDTWNMYQTKDLPDEEELTEWPDHTQTGFPIGVYPRSNVIFDVQVDDVPSRVCKQVLNMNLEGPLFIWTPNGEGKTIYNGTNAQEVCGEEETTSSMVFTTTLESYGNAEGLRGDLTDERGQPMRYCVEDEDCRSCERCGDAHTCESACSDDQPICMQKEGNEAKCVECELTSDCSSGQICDDTTYTCQPIPAKCAEGEFRSKNGACVPCNEPANIIISPEKFTAPGIEDELTGEEMCNACATATTNKTARKMETDKSGRKYCSYGCTLGLSFQTTSGECIPCYDENGEPSTKVGVIASGWKWNSLVNKETEAQCLACPNHDWWNHYLGGVKCGPAPDCPEGQYLASIWGGDWSYKCFKCEEDRNAGPQLGWDANGSFDIAARMQTQCRNCPEYVNGKYARRWVNGNCWQMCQQPENEEKSIAICQANPNSPNCKRQWQDGNASCFSCNYMGSNKAIGSNGTLKSLCEKCGRKVNNKGYCVPKEGAACPLGEFLGSDGACHSCTGNGAVEIDSEEASRCEANCRVKTYNSRGEPATYYGPSDDPTEAAKAPTGKFVYRSNASSYSCMRKCGPGYWLTGQSNCKLCTDNAVNEGPILWENSASDGSLAKICTQCNPKRVADISRYGYNGCQIEDCSAVLDKTEKKYKYLHVDYGHCARCDSSTVKFSSWLKLDLFKKECENCGNRVYFRESCILIDPGRTGVCNSVENPGKETLSDDLQKKAGDYYNGKFDTKLFRDNGYVCHACSEEKSIPSSVAQCKSCGNRRYENGNCVFGLCTEKVAFLNSSSACISCDITTARTDIDNTEVAKRLCNYCDNKRVMTTIDKTYCVADCAPGQWQDLNGTCRTDAGGAEIGTDETSRTLCRNVGHIAYSKSDANEKIHWYCSQKPQANTFINMNGGNTNCSAGRTEIPNTQDAKNLCLGEYGDGLGCVSVERFVETDEDGRVYCVK